MFVDWNIQCQLLLSVNKQNYSLSISRYNSLLSE